MAEETLETRVARLDERMKGTDEKVNTLVTSQLGQSAQLALLVADMHKRHGAEATKKSMRSTIFTVLTSTGFLGWIWEHFHK